MPNVQQKCNIWYANEARSHFAQAGGIGRSSEDGAIQVKPPTWHRADPARALASWLLGAAGDRRAVALGWPGCCSSGVTEEGELGRIDLSDGRASHLDTFDLKPEAPVEIRGEFKTIATRAPGVGICEHLPQLAARADKLAVIRSMTHGLPSHEHATHMMLTGVNDLPPGSTHMASRADWPCYASGLDFVHPRSDGVPNGVHLPTYLNNGYGFSGQNAGVLGAKFDPWHIKADPSEASFRVDELTLPVGLTAEKVGHRRALLAEIDRQSAAVDGMGTGRAFTGIQDKAFTMLTSSGVKRAFELDREDPRLRDRYGHHMFGQSLLLTRRLIQAGVPIVQANMGHMNNWDTHIDNCTAAPYAVAAAA